MARIFVSYKRGAVPDERLAEFFVENLTRRGHEVFIDTQIPIGQYWPTVIKRELERATSFVVLLSEASANSEMVIQEVKLAHNHRRDHGMPTILPVRVRYRGSCAYDLDAILDRVQCAMWDKEGDETEICERLHACIDGQRTMKGGEMSGQPTDSAAPAPRHDPRLLDPPGGAVRASSPFYVERGNDRLLKEVILGSGVTALVKGPGQVGKSSLLARLYQHACVNGLPVLLLDFQGVDEPNLQDLDQLLRYIAKRISLRLRTSQPPEDYWDVSLGPMDNLSSFLTAEVLEPSDKPFVLFMDGVDRLFSQSYRDDFFSLIRSWHNDRALTGSHFQKLNVVLSYSTEAHLFISNLNQSPFNVGVKFELNDFSRSQMEKLNTLHGGPITTADDMDAVVGLLSGHPFLVRQTFYDVAQRRWTVKELMQRACDDDGPYADHLRHHLLALESRPELRTELKSAIRGKICSSDLLFCQLRAGGLVKGPSRSSVRLRCGLYERYFGERL